MIRLFLLFSSFCVPIFSLCQSLILVDLNIRYDNPSDGENAWRKRKVSTLGWLKDQEADLYFFQEVLHHQYIDLQEKLDGYQYYGVGREDGNKKGEYCPIFYKTDRFDLKDTLTIWLSLNLTIPGKGWDAACERVATLVILTDKRDGQTLVCINTHWDHVGKIAQEKSAELILQLLELCPSPYTLIGGDFNVTSDHIGIQNLSRQLPLVKTSEIRNTYHGFQTAIESSHGPIDLIFASEKLKATKYQYFRHANNGQLLSDHDAIRVELIKMNKE